MTEYDEIAEKKIQKTLQRKAEQLKLRRKQRWNADFGMIASLGGVFIVPILLGIWGGKWLDEVFPQSFSWQLSLLFGGMLWGLINAYFWLKIENEKIARHEQHNEQEIKKGLHK